MSSLFDLIRYNNTHYKELNDDKDKARIEKFVDCIQRVGLEEVILSFGPNNYFNARWFEHHGRDFVHTLPDDLARKMIVLWLNIEDEEPLVAYRKLFPA